MILNEERNINPVAQNEVKEANEHNINDVMQERSSEQPSADSRGSVDRQSIKELIGEAAQKLEKTQLPKGWGDKVPDEQSQLNQKSKSEESNSAEVAHPQESKPQESAKQAAKQEQVRQASKYEAMDYWNAKQKAFFNSLDDKMKEDVLDFISDNQKIYEHVTNSYKNDYVAMQDMLEPVMESLGSQIETKSLAPEEIKAYVGGLIENNRIIDTDPALAISIIAQKYNVSQEDVDEAYYRFGRQRQMQRQVEPVARQMQQQIGQLNERLEGYENDRYAQELNGLYAKLRLEKDGYGNLKYKYLDKIGLDDFMMILENVGVDNFDKGYQSYIWAAPDIRQELIKETNEQGLRAQGSKTQEAKLQEWQAEGKGSVQSRVLPTSIPQGSGMTIQAADGKGKGKTAAEAFYEAIEKYGSY
jgi:hypothetical protein